MIIRLLTGPTNDGRIQLLRYFFVGGGAFAVDFGLLYLLTELGIVLSALGGSCVHDWFDGKLCFEREVGFS